MATKTRPTAFVSPKIARLREVSGHNGPWSSSEYEAAIGTISPTTGDDPQPPAEVTELAEARDIALAKFERADAEWRESCAAERRAQYAGQVRISRLGELLTDPRAPKNLRRVRAELDERADARKLAAAELKRTSVKWRDADTRWRHQMLADAYDQTAQR